ncbi:hypothetical protein SprV_0301377400 [Sparganum proliferum]
MKPDEMNLFLIFIGSITVLAAVPFGGAFTFADDLDTEAFHLPDRFYPSSRYPLLTDEELQAEDGEIYFEDCFELTCHAGDYGGFGCRDGFCDYICEPDGCYETERLKASGGRASRSVGAIRRQAHLRHDFSGHLEIFGRVDFEGCSAKHCRFGEYEGYACHEGICGYVCKGTMCRSRLKELSEDKSAADDPDDYEDYDEDEYDEY